jgi:hypothetical protein
MRKKRATEPFVATSKRARLREASALNATAEADRSPGFKGVLTQLFIETGRRLMT